MNRRLMIGGAGAAGAILFVALGGYSWITGDDNVEDLLNDTGVLGPIIFVLIMWVTQPIGTPGLVYMVPASLVWAAPMAIALVWIGNMGSSYIAFRLARWLGQDWVHGRIPDRMRRFDDRIEAGGLRPVIGLRLLFGQLPPSDWLLGVTKVTNRNFIIGTGIGIIPGITVIILAGEGAFDLLGDMAPTTRWILVGALVIVAVGRRVLKRLLQSSDEATADPAPS